MRKSLFSTLEETAHSSRVHVEAILADGRGDHKYKQFTRTWKTADVIQMLDITQRELREAGEALNIYPEKAIAGFYEYTLGQIQQLRRKIHGTQTPRTLPVVSILSGKGGCSKTTVSVYLAQKLVLDGKRVLFIDTDPQASATSIILGVNPDIEFEADDTIAPFMMEREISLVDRVIKTGMPSLDIIPCCQGASIMDLEGMAGDSETKEEMVDRFWSLKETLTLFKGEYDVIVIDTPPTVTFTNMRCAIASNLIITPIAPSMTDICSSTGYENTLKDYLESLIAVAPHQPLELFDRRFLVSQYNHQLQSHRKFAELIRKIYPRTLNTPFANLAEISNTNQNGKTIYEERSAISSSSTRKRALILLDSLFQEIISDIEALSALSTNQLHTSEVRHYG